MKQLIAILLILWPTIALAQIKGPDSVPPYTIITVSTDLQADSFIWFVEPFNQTHISESITPRKMQFTGHPGEHKVTLIAIKAGVQQSYTKSISISGSPNPEEKDPIVKMGMQFGKELRYTFATSLSESIAEINAGTPIEVARTNHTNRWKKYREDIFDKNFVPLFDGIIKDRNPTAQQLKQYTDALSKIAVGVAK